MSEFQLKSFAFTHDRVYNFVESQWDFISPKLFTCYRVIMAIGMVLWAISDFASEWLNSYRGYPYFWLLMATNWAFMAMVIAHIALAFVNILTNCHDVGVVCYILSYLGAGFSCCITDAFKQPSRLFVFWPGSLHFLEVFVYLFRSQNVVGYKMCWIFYNIACNSVLTTSIIYLFALLNSEQEIFNTTQSKIKHCLNALLILFDLAICSIPIRLFHFIYPFILGILYTIMLVIYYYGGGIGPNGKPYIYEALYWKYPGSAIVAVVCVIIMSILIQLFLFIFVQARIWLYKLIYGDTVTMHQSKCEEDDQIPIMNNDYNSYSTIE